MRQVLGSFAFCLLLLPATLGCGGEKASPGGPSGGGGQANLVSRACDKLAECAPGLHVAQCEAGLAACEASCIENASCGEIEGLADASDPSDPIHACLNACTSVSSSSGVPASGVGGSGGSPHSTGSSGPSGSSGSSGSGGHSTGSSPHSGWGCADDGSTCLCYDPGNASYDAPACGSGYSCCWAADYPQGRECECVTTSSCTKSNPDAHRVGSCPP